MHWLMSLIREFFEKERQPGTSETGQVSLKTGPAAALLIGGVVKVLDHRVSVGKRKRSECL